ncbi:MAG: hypothetical protein M1824_000526 [Vezdaea acicularis]|nr:MAG: hypothetical protein M1824_000526 [Vezdaea acicularis]
MATAEVKNNSRPEGLEIASPPLARGPSSSSDRPSLSRYPSLMSPPAATSPEAAYIAASAASQIVSSHHDATAQDLNEHDIEPSGETAYVSPGSLKLVNSFLDQLLYNFLSVARSTSLASLRPAVSEVLKPKLGREAITGADQELHEYLGGGADEELLTFHNGQEPTGDWDLEAVWKRTRLRCMVYSSLGDLEEEDEDRFADEESFDGGNGAHGHVRNAPIIVSPAVAIFLTSILEFIGEQVLTVAGKAAYNRVAAANLANDQPAQSEYQSEIADRVVIEELDTEKVAMNPTLGRLWRTWRKRLRSPSLSHARQISTDSYKRNYQPSYAGSSRRSSIDNAENTTDVISRGSLAEVPEEDYAAYIPLPVSQNDIEEIEVPGLVNMDDTDDESVQTEVAPPMRRKSMIVYQSRDLDLATPTTSTREELRDSRQTSAPDNGRARSKSTPAPQRLPLVLDSESSQAESADPEAVDAEEIDEAQFVTPMESSDPMNAVKIDQLTSLPKDGVPEDADEASTPTGPPKVLDGREKPSETHHTEGDKDEASTFSPSKGLIGGMITGTAALGAAAVAGITGHRKRENLGSETREEPKQEEPRELEVASKPVFDPERHDDDFEEEPEIMESTRMSVEAPRTPEIVQTRSRAASAAAMHAQMVADDEANAHHGAHGLGIHDNNLEFVDEDPSAIGVARTSNVSMPAITLPPSPRSSSGRPSPEQKNVEAVRNGHDGLNSGSIIVHEVRDDSVAQDTQKPRFVLAAPPASRRSPGSTSPNPDQSSLVPSGNLAPVSKTPGAEYGVPPLTPLREMMEAAHDTSDEADSITQSHDATASEPSLHAVPTSIGHIPQDSIASSNYSHAQQSSNASSMFPEMQNQMPPMPIGTASERAGVQRVYTPPITPRDAPNGTVRRSDSLSKENRQIYTSGSQGSQVSNKLKGLIGLPQDNPDKPLPQLRTSEDDSGSAGSARHAQVGSKAADKEESFEQLIRSDETLQYTLTPQTVREEGRQATPEVTKATVAQPLTEHQNWPQQHHQQQQQQRAPTADLADFLRNTGPGVDQDSRPLTQRSVQSFSRPTNNVPNGLRANPLSPGTSSSNVVPSVAKYIPKSRPPPPSSPRARAPRPGAPVARDARSHRESTRDIADFLRSTGPEGSSGFSAASSSQAQNGGTASNGRANGTGSASGVRSAASVRSETYSTMSNSSARLRLQAREASVPYGDHSSDLVDFIRQGPPTQSFGQNSRLPQGTRAGTANTSAKRSPSLTSTRPGPSTYNESKGPSSRNGQAAAKAPPSYTRIVDDSPPASSAPIRKQRRVKDPYAIDTDSEDEEQMGGPRPRGEESMIDFLRNVPPPRGSDPVPFTASTSAGGPVQSQSTQPRVNSNGSQSSRSLTNGYNPQASRQPPSRAGTGAPQLPLFESGGLDMGSYTPAQSRGSTTSRTSAGTHQARGGRYVQTETSEMADFLKNSGPPVSSQTYSPPAKDAGGFSKMFRRKKTAAY